MFDRIAIPLAVTGLVATVPMAAWTPQVQTPAPVAGPAPVPGRIFPVGAEVLSVDGERLGVLARMETRPGGERILHIRRTDGSMTTAPAVVAFRGERAVVLEWTRAEFESGAAAVEVAPANSAGPSEPARPGL